MEQKDLGTLAEVSELLEGWAQSAGGAPCAVRALLYAADLAERELGQASRSAQLQRQAQELAANGGGDAAVEQAAVLAQLAGLRSEAGDLNGAIDAYEQSLDVDANMDVVGQLAELFARRGADGDREQAADLYCTLGEALGNPAGIPMLERALDQDPSHTEATALLEQFLSARVLRARSGRTVVGFKLGSDPDADHPLATLDGTRIPSASQPPPAAMQPPAASMQLPPAAAMPRPSARPMPVDVVARSLVPASSARSSAPPAHAAAAPQRISSPAAAQRISVPSGVQLISVAPAAAAAQVATPVVSVAPVQPPVVAQTSPAPVAATFAAPPTVVTFDDDEPVTPKARLPLPGKLWLIGGAVLVVGVLASTLFRSPTGKTERAALPSALAAAPTPVPVAAVPAPAPIPTPSTPTPTAAVAAAAVSGETPAAAPAPEKPKRKSPSVHAKISAATVRGGKLSDDQLSAALDKATPKLERCYAQALKKKPRTDGSLTLSWTVRTTGKVVGIKKVGGTIKDTKLYRCSALAISGTKFPKPAKKAALVKMPLEYAME